MGSTTWGTGTDTFGVDYLDAQVPNSGSSEWQSSDIYAHMLSALELRRMSGHFDAGADTTTGSSTPADTPLSLKQEGASSGYYRTIHYSSHADNNYFFSQNVLMYDRHIITNVTDIQRLVWKPTITEDTFTNAAMVDGTTRTITCYSISQFESSKVDILKKGKLDQYTATNINVVPAIISPDSTNHLQGFNYWGRVDERATWVDRVVYRYNQTYGSNSNNVPRYCPVFGNQSPIILPNSSGETSKWAIDDTGNYAARFVYKAADQYSYLWTTYCNVKYWVCSEDELLHVLARSGMKFVYKNTMYKPVAENGVITGYTDDMDKKSDWDKWHDYNDHEVPITPPAPTPSGDDEDNEDPIPTVGAPYSSGLARYYVTTAGSVILNHISEAMGAWDLINSGKDLYKNIISCKLIKSPAPIPVSGSEPFVIYGVTPQYQGADITLPLVNDNPTASFGPYSIPRKFNDFRDFAPYTRCEIYLPYCGWTQLPSHVVGRSVSVTYYTDIIAGTCKATVYCNSNAVAEAAGVIGLDIPMVTENAGAKAEAVTMGLLAYGKAGLQTALGVGAAVATKGKAGVKTAVSGLENVVSAYSQTAMAFNQNYTEINGKNGDGCCIAGISAIVIKITRPKYGSNTVPPFVPAEYPHAVGYVSMKSMKVGSVTGLLVGSNVDVSGIAGATDREKEIIKRTIENGIIVNSSSD